MNQEDVASPYSIPINKLGREKQKFPTGQTPLCSACTHNALMATKINGAKA